MGTERGEKTCITSWDSKCNVRTRNAIIMRTRPRSRRDARRTRREKEDGRDKETRARTRTLPGVTHPESAVATVLLRGDKFSNRKVPRPTFGKCRGSVSPSREHKISRLSFIRNPEKYEYPGISNLRLNTRGPYYSPCFSHSLKIIASFFSKVRSLLLSYNIYKFSNTKYKQN